MRGMKAPFQKIIEDEVSSLDYGIIGNITYVLGKAHKGRGVHIHIRYYQGLENVFENSYTSESVRTQFISLHLSLPFITDELAEKNLREG
jgi:hypothetical protein